MLKPATIIAGLLITTAAPAALRPTDLDQARCRRVLEIGEIQFAARKPQPGETPEQAIQREYGANAALPLIIRRSAQQYRQDRQMWTHTTPADNAQLTSAADEEQKKQASLRLVARPDGQSPYTDRLFTRIAECWKQFPTLAGK